MNTNLKSIFIFFFIFISFESLAQVGGETCPQMQPICTGSGVQFTANDNGPDVNVSEPGNNYGCLDYSPNPSWYYLEIATAGDLIFELSAPSDIDFIMWGPYNNLATAQATCGSHNNVLPDSGCDFLGLNCDSYGCSWDITNVETPGIYDAQVGEVYVLLITNYANSVQNISLTQTGGTGATDCTILNNCNISGLTATPGACNPANNLFTLSGSVTFTDAPASGTLTVTNSCGGSQTFNAPFTSPQAYSIAGINSNGAACSVTATFSADPGCTRTMNYTAPANCLPAACFMTGINIATTACDPADNTYDVTGSVSFTDPPASGTLTITSSCGGTQTFNAPFTSPQAFTLSNINADGTTNCSVTASFSATACTITSLTFTEPICPCNIDFIQLNQGACDGTNNTYSVDITVTFSTPPSSGTLDVFYCGQTTSIPLPATSPQTVTMSGFPADGLDCNWGAVFSANPACATPPLTYTAPANCLCDTYAGTFTDNLTGNSAVNTLLCFNDNLNIVGNGDFIPVDDLTATWNPPPVPVYDPGLWMALYSCPPSVFPPDLITDDPCFLGIYSSDDGNWDVLNDIGDGSTYYFAPLTMYSMVEGIYGVYINGGDLCWDLGEVFPLTFLPEVTATGVESCPNGTVTVTVQGGVPATTGGNFTASNLLPATASFNNTTAANGGTIVVSGLTDGQMYSFDIEDANGCPVTFSGGPFNGPDATTINPAGPFCLSDASVNLTETPVTAGTWTGTGITNGATGTFDPATAGIGTHTITFTPSGCFLPSTVDINVNDVYDASITPAGPFCETDAAVTLVPAVDLGGTWSGTGITDVNAGTFDPAVATPGTYTITYTIAGTCGDVQTTSIDVVPLVDPTITPAGPFCDVDPAVTLVAAQTGGTWSGTGITDMNNGVFDPSVSGAGSFTITYDITGFCGASDDIVIDVASQFDATIAPAGPFCQSNGNTFLGATDGGGTWSGTGIVGGTNTTGEFSPTLAGAGNHTITYTILGACGDVGTTTIQVIADADATITPAGPFCITDPSVNLVGAQTGGVWSGTGITSAANGTFSPAGAGAGTHTITYNISGVCGDLQTTDIVVIDLFPSTITPVGPFCEDANPVTLVGATAGGTWSGTGITNTTTGTFDPDVAGPGTHTITYALSGSCATTSTIDIVVNPLPVPTFTADVLEGCAPLTVTFSDNTIPAASSTVWTIIGETSSNSNGSFTYTFNDPGLYSVTLTLTSAAGCVGTTTITNMIEVFPNPIADFTFGPEGADVTNPVIDFVNQSFLNDINNWDFGGLGTSTQVHPSFGFPNTPGEYTVCLEVSTVNGCLDTTCQTIIINDIFIIYVPNAFTPDGDGINEIFLPIISGIDPESYELMIFNRWGELIFETNVLEQWWDGTHKSLLCESEVYVWKIKLKDAIENKKREYIGHVTLLK